MTAIPAANRAVFSLMQNRVTASVLLVRGAFYFDVLPPDEPDDLLLPLPDVPLLPEEPVLPDEPEVPEVPLVPDEPDEPVSDARRSQPVANIALNKVTASIVLEIFDIAFILVILSIKIGLFKFAHIIYKKQCSFRY